MLTKSNRTKKSPAPLQIPPGFLSVRLAAAWAGGRSVSTLERWIRRGLPVYRESPRGARLVKPSDIEHFLTREIRPTPNLEAIVNDAVAGVLQGGGRAR